MTVVAHSSLRTHRKFMRFRKELVKDEARAYGLLNLLWDTAHKDHSIGEDGMLTGWSVQDIAAVAGWTRNPEDLVRALRSSGFLDGCPPQAALHNYQRWAPDYVKKRWLRAKPENKTLRKGVLSTKDLRQLCPDGGRTCPDDGKTSPAHTTQHNTTNTPLRGVPRKRARDALFDSVCQEFGHDPKALTKTQRGRINKALKDLREQGATPPDIPVRAARYRKKWPDIECTVTALALHWPEFAEDTAGDADWRLKPGELTDD